MFGDVHKGLVRPPRSSATGALPEARRCCAKLNGANAPGYGSNLNTPPKSDAEHAPPQGATIQNFPMAYEPNVLALAAATSSRVCSAYTKTTATSIAHAAPGAQFRSRFPGKDVQRDPGPSLHVATRTGPNYIGRICDKTPSRDRIKETTKNGST